MTGAGPTLHLVATPIGNLGDLPPRAIDVLRDVALVCCEDSRRTGRLLQHAGVKAARLAVCNEHTELSRIADVLDTLSRGDDVALVTDAGTPGISDPGERLVRAALDAGFRVSAVPGPVAAVTALVISGLPTSRYVFEGFIPRSGKERTNRLAEIAAEPRTVVIYEAPHRIQRTLRDLAGACGDDRQITIARELTKLYEEVTRATLGTIDVGEPRGEYVIVLAGSSSTTEPPDDDTIRSALRAHIDAGATRRDAATAVAGQLGVPKRTAYALATGMSRAGTLTGEVSEHGT
ncbi:MAG TPA: 16S rRNA (cytidine(1402)-2'-O)-methyltransferase [Ilumatobacteraceae bacterium]|nr:16S rRNA (cytidine(1402)-2'-O)-methyltransferase [Ilumatobacteraceae bacterium]